MPSPRATRIEYEKVKLAGVSELALRDDNSALDNLVMPRRYRRVSFGEVHRLVESAFRELGRFGDDVAVQEKINRLGEGLWHDNYRFWISGKSVPPDWADRAYVLRLLVQRYEWQEGPEPKERMLNEAQTLLTLKELEFCYLTPEFICFVRANSEIIGMIETAVPGASLESLNSENTLGTIGRVAAAVHSLGHQRFDHLARSPDRAEHVMERVNEITPDVFHQFPLAVEAREWVFAHLPPSDSPCLLHGDLLPQNLLWSMRDWQREHEQIGIVDWEMARVGDPAYDLAIVSRANRKVLGVNDGLKPLLQAYLNAGGQPISLRDVRVHEVLLVLYWLEDSWLRHLKGNPSGQGPEYYEQQLRSLLRRAASEA